MGETFGEALRRFRTRAGLSQPALARRVYVAQSTISRIETGRQTEIDEDLAERLDSALEADGTLLARRAAFSAPDHGHPALGESVVASTTDYDRGRPVDADYVDALRATIHHLVALDSAHGGGDTSRLAVRTFNSAHRKLTAGYYLPKVERDFEAVTAELGEVAGWLCYDAERQTEARQLNLEALALSRLAGDRPMELFVLSNQAMMSLHTGRPQEALRIADSVLEHNHLPPRLGVLFRIRRARALAALGDRTSALVEYARVRSLFAEGVSRHDPSWTWWITDRELRWHEGMGLTSLGDWSAAIPRFVAAVDCPRFPRGLYVSRTYLLEALVRAEAWPDAETVALDTLPMVGEVGSIRAERVLGGIAARSHHGGSPMSASLSDIMSEISNRIRAA
ncbi:hypothetical protein GCM10012275_51100 [Longimycelium tulufanense]|uniref:HTH cro/C1-type domain-containing protein n=1 Tax=Longimycelium tulufanense TaxID=907463 RepID=A0A8J3CIY9_9PSEU|nr:helix-turn-helix transcriptional regulator [Longimycelium tulufanense]GGM74172.1 hypothetical protein GCM10012275_51100 [Longimycelium tulufanense]